MASKNRRQNVEFEVILPATGEQIQDHLYLAGDFNGWHTADPDYHIKQTRNGKYKLKTKLSVGAHAFKVVRGSWQTVETDHEGGAIANRTMLVEKQSGRTPIEVRLEVAGFADSFPVPAPPSTISSNVTILEEAFEIPQLARKRRIWIYLPADYQQHTTQHYPVIYMQDGQNLFDAATAFSGEWGIDKYLNTLGAEKQCIVVGIDNGGNNRMQEYNPYTNKQFGKGEGKAYVEFIVKTLKPYIDLHYRTQKEAKYTTVSGSSMGGLISYYAAIRYPDIIGNAGVFSPSFWIAPDIYQVTKKLLPELSGSNFYFYGGEREGEDLISHLKLTTSLLAGNPKIHTSLEINPEGTHQEIYWGEAFKAFYEWLLARQAVH